jgi:hypothetical protein
MVKTVLKSNLVRRIITEKLKSKKMDLHSRIRHVGGEHVVGWLAVREMEMGTWLIGPLTGWLAGASNNYWKP